MSLARFRETAAAASPARSPIDDPLITGIDATIDYRRAKAARTAFQTTLDSTALRLSNTAATDSPDNLQTEATDAFSALFQRSDSRT